LSVRRGTLKKPVQGRQAQKGTAMKTVMGWIDKIVSSLAKRKVNKDEGRSNSR
jgi:hypothetical protein